MSDRSTDYTAASTGFDRFVVVDWSAASSPVTGADSIWSIAVDAHGRGRRPEPVNHATRSAARKHLIALLAATPPGSRTLVGIDVSLGYPSGFATRAGLADAGTAPWIATWRHLAAAITDDHRNRNNRWQVAADLNRRLGVGQFWGAPAAQAGPHLTSKRPERSDTHLAELRATETALLRAGMRPFSSWQLLGAGAVGSQALTAIPVLQHLRTNDALAGRIAVWPFETGLRCPAQPDIVIAEVWPSALAPDAVDAEPHDVKDARQVSALARHLAALQRADRLADWFSPTVPADQVAAVVAEEGWVLGAA